MGNLVLDCSPWGILERMDERFRELPDDKISGYATITKECENCGGRGSSCHALSNFLMDIEFRKCTECDGEGHLTRTFRIL